MKLAVGDVVHATGMNGRPQRWTVEAVGPENVRLDGIWFRASQVRQWLKQGAYSVTKGAERTEEQT